VAAAEITESGCVTKHLTLASLLVLAWVEGRPGHGIVWDLRWSISLDGYLWTGIADGELLDYGVLCICMSLMVGVFEDVAVERCNSYHVVEVKTSKYKTTYSITLLLALKYNYFQSPTQTHVNPTINKAPGGSP
jgi:hypothetical protein